MSLGGRWTRRSHAEVRAVNSCHRFVVPADFYLGSSSPTEQVEEQFTRCGAQSRGRMAPPHSESLAGSCSLDFQAGAAQASAQEAATSANVAPQGGLQIVREGTWPEPVGSPYVFVMHEELVEVREASNPPDAEECPRWPGSDGRDEIGERRLLQRAPSPFGESAPRSGDDQSGRGEQIALPEDEVGHEVMRRPPVEQGRGLGTELVEKVAQLKTFLSVERERPHKWPSVPPEPCWRCRRPRVHATDWASPRRTRRRLI